MCQKNSKAVAVHGIVMLDEHSDLVGSDRERFEDARRPSTSGIGKKGLVAVSPPFL